jgi:hypothetical protein
MLIALTENKERIKPVRGVNTYCPSCMKDVIPKMGEIKIHHWAHKAKSDCAYGKGMTEWHYRWIDRHYQKGDWEIEHIDGNRRYDCFSASKNLVLEIQKIPAYEYIIDKTRCVLERGYELNWIFHEDVLQSLKKTEFLFEASSRRRLVILDVLQEFSTDDKVRFFIDSLANTAKGKSSKGLLHLMPIDKTKANYWDYFKVPYKKYGKRSTSLPQPE